MTRPGIEPRSPRPLANTLTARPMSGIMFIDKNIHIIKNNANTHTHTHIHTHTHTQVFLLECTCFWDKEIEREREWCRKKKKLVCMFTKKYICIFRQHFFVNANFIKHNRHFMPTYSLLDPFEFPYYFYRIRGELI